MYLASMPDDEKSPQVYWRMCSVSMTWGYTCECPWCHRAYEMFLYHKIWIPKKRNVHIYTTCWTSTPCVKLSDIG